MSPDEAKPSPNEPAQPVEAAAAPPAAANAVVSSADRYLVSSKRSGLGVQGAVGAPLDIKRIVESLGGAHEQTLKARGPGLLSVMAAGGSSEVEVVRMEPDQAELLRLQIGSRVNVDLSPPLSYGPVGPANPSAAVRGLSVTASSVARLTVTVTVVGANGAPIEGAQVDIFGSRTDASQLTDANGQAVLTLGGETTDTISMLVASPRSGYWMTAIRSPHLDPARNNVVTAIPLDQQFPGFPQQEIEGWGLEALGIGQLAPERRGQGVNVGVIDSGIAKDHPDLAGQVVGGTCFAPGLAADAWSQDDEGHGTHVAGIIAGLPNQLGIRGVAPGAKLRSYKIFPGGSFPELWQALQQCMEDQVDVVNLSLGASGAFLSDIATAIEMAKSQGIACIVAAGNASGPVQFPGSAPDALAVAALGRENTFPPGTWHAYEAVRSGGVDVSADGYFSPVFTCFGPEVAISAPGVAVISAFPPDTYAALDGTSMAAPHVTGLAALVLAHHPDFQGPFKLRNRARVERLFAILKQGAQPVTLGAAAASQPRTGAGLASVTGALNVAGSAAPAIAPAAADLFSLLRLMPSAVTNGSLAPSDVLASAFVEGLREILAQQLSSESELPVNVVARR